MTVPWPTGRVFSTYAGRRGSLHIGEFAFGATKTWLWIPRGGCCEVEEAMREAVPELFETNPILLLARHSVPDQLKKAGVRGVRLDQGPDNSSSHYRKHNTRGSTMGSTSIGCQFRSIMTGPFGEVGVQR